MNITANFIYGTDAVRHYDETGEVPSNEELEDLGGVILEKNFKSEEEYKAYVEALSDLDGWSAWAIAEERHESPEHPSLDYLIKDAMKEGPLVALYFYTGINLLKDVIDTMTDEEIKYMFSNLIHPDRVRSNVEIIFNKLSNK